MDTDNVVVGVGALSNATRPLFPAPSASNGGGITVVSANVVQGSAGTAGYSLVKGTLNGGTFTANGTISTADIGGTAAANLWVAGVVKSFAVGGTAVFVQAGEWVALKETNVGAGATVTAVHVGYADGR